MSRLKKRSADLISQRFAGLMSNTDRVSVYPCMCQCKTLDGVTYELVGLTKGYFPWPDLQLTPSNMSAC